MFYSNVQSNEKPSSVLVERLPDGSANVRLADNIVEKTVTEETGEQKVYEYDEVTFLLEAGRDETAKSIKKNFADWWDYGKQPEEAPLTLEERVSELEDVILSILSE